MIQGRQLKPSTATLQDDAERFIIKAMELLHDPATRGAWSQLLATYPNDPVRSLAEAIVVLLTKMDAAARDTGIEVNDTAKLYGVAELSPQLYEIGEKTKAMKLTPDEQQLALGSAIQKYIEIEAKANRIDLKRLHAETQKSMASVDPKRRAEINASMQKMAATGKAYSARRGIK